MGCTIALRTNDFRHGADRIEGTVAKIDQGLRDVGDRIERMEARLLAAVQRRPDTDGEPGS